MIFYSFKIYFGQWCFELLDFFDKVFCGIIKNTTFAVLKI